MKHLLLVAALLTTAPAIAQDLSAALTPTITAFDTTWNDPAAKTALGNRLELIAKKWPDQWITSYYAAYSKAQLSYNEKEAAKKDAMLDAGEDHLATTVKLLGKETDETHVLRALLANARIGVDPQSRWQKWGKQFDAELDAAKELNADNPRIYLLRGMSKFYTPKMFGGGKKAARPYFEKSEALFAKNPATDMNTPSWGRPMLGWFMTQINDGKSED